MIRKLVLTLVVGFGTLLYFKLRNDRQEHEVDAGDWVPTTGVVACDALGNNGANDDSEEGGEEDGVPEEVVELWAAAERGDVAAVRRLLRRHNFPADMLHPESGVTLFLSVAHVRTYDADLDRRLKDVMHLLVREGCSLQRRTFPSNDTAAHLLAAQPVGCRVHHRLMFIERRLRAQPRRYNMLGMLNRGGRMPEEEAMAVRMSGLHAWLHEARLRIEDAAVRQAAEPQRNGPLALLRSWFTRV